MNPETLCELAKLSRRIELVEAVLQLRGGRTNLHDDLAKLTERVGELEKRQEAMDKLHHKGVPYGEESGEHNWPEKPKTFVNCKDCANADCKFKGFDQTGWRDCFVEKPRTCGTCSRAYWKKTEPLFGFCPAVAFGDPDPNPGGWTRSWYEACPKYEEA